jgi:hypothetical protein
MGVNELGKIQRLEFFKYLSQWFERKGASRYFS